MSDEFRLKKHVNKFGVFWKNTLHTFGRNSRSFQRFSMIFCPAWSCGAPLENLRDHIKFLKLVFVIHPIKVIQKVIKSDHFLGGFRAHGNRGNTWWSYPQMVLSENKYVKLQSYPFSARLECVSETKVKICHFVVSPTSGTSPKTDTWARWLGGVCWTVQRTCTLEI